MNYRTPQIRLVIADDHPVYRYGLRRLLEAEIDLKVLGEASDGAEAVKLARQLKPDILLLDLRMPKTPRLGSVTGTKYFDQRDPSQSDPSDGGHREEPDC